MIVNERRMFIANKNSTVTIATGVNMPPSASGAYVVEERYNTLVKSCNSSVTLATSVNISRKVEERYNTRARNEGNSILYAKHDSATHWVLLRINALFLM